MGSIPATRSTKHASCFPPSSLPASIEISIKLVVCMVQRSSLDFIFKALLCTIENCTTDFQESQSFSKMHEEKCLLLQRELDDKNSELSQH
jgi:hypothetical protein